MSGQYEKFQFNSTYGKRREFSNYRPLPFRLVPERPAASTFILSVHCIRATPTIVEDSGILKVLPPIFG